MTEKVNFDESVLNQQGLILVKFYAVWCAPCKALTPLLKSISEEYNIPIVEVDAELNSEIMQKYGFRNVPTTVLFKDGEILQQLVGMLPRSKLVEKLITPYV